ncbi:MAG: Holliday junction resolvase RuvX [Eubacteriales bacterium]|nr:Holliday junction resolvase RuvX [Eubacteriales bacterium]
MGRLMGLDFGSKTVGVALSDELQVIASPVETITRDRESKIRPTLRRLSDIAALKDVELIVVGDPVNMDGSSGERSLKSREFAENLRYRLMQDGLNIEVVMYDERLTTIGADEILEEANVRASERKTYIDKIAASLILETFMKERNNNDAGR